MSADKPFLFEDSDCLPRDFHDIKDIAFARITIRFFALALNGCEKVMLSLFPWDKAFWKRKAGG